VNSADATSDTWGQTAEQLFGCVDGEGFAPTLLGTLEELVAFDRGLLYIVRRGAPSWILFDQSASHASPQCETHAHRSGGYLLDPYDPAFLDRAPDGFYTDAAGAENVRGWAGAPHVAFLAPVSDGACLVLLLLRDSYRPSFLPVELSRCRRAQGVVCAALRLHWRSYAAARVVSRRSVASAGLQQRVEAALDRFGSELLTRREGQVVRLLLRGSSTKAAADQLGIAAATAALHRKRAYAKLGVRSQAQLFYRFICSLSADARVGGKVQPGQDSWPLAASAGP